MNNKVISDSGIKRLLVSHNIFVAARIAFTLFFNVYIWKQTEDLNLVAWFNIVYLLLHTLTFHAFARLVKKGKVHFARITALAGYTLVYLGVYLLKENAIYYAIPIAVAIGFFNGMYWIAYQVLRFDLTNSENRGNYTGMESGLKTFVDITTPVLSGAIITANFLGWGYSNLFLVGTLLFLASFVIGNIKFPVYSTPNFHIKKTFLIIMKNKDVMKSMLAYFLSGLSRRGTIKNLILPLLIFDVMKNELQLGFWLSLFSVVSIFGSLALGKFIKYKYYKNLIFYGGVTYFILLMLLILFPSFWMYILFGALIKIVDSSIHIPKRVISENLVHSLENEETHRVEYIVIREWCSIGFGRVASFLLLFLVGDLIIGEMKILLIPIAIGVLMEVFLLRSIKREVA